MITLFCVCFPALWLCLPNLLLICLNTSFGLSLKSIGLLLTVFCTLPILLLLAKNLKQFWLWNLPFALLSAFYSGYICYFHDIPYDGMWFAIWNVSPDVFSGTIKYFVIYSIIGVSGFILYCACLLHPIQKKILISTNKKLYITLSSLLFIAIGINFTNFLSQKIPIQRVLDETVVFRNYPYGMLMMVTKTALAFSKNKPISLSPLKRTHITPGREIVVFVIGEAERVDDWLTIAKMTHSTLLTDPSILRFEHAVSQANLTSAAEQLMLSGTSTIQESFQHPLWIDIARAAGCKTGWITNAREPFDLPYHNDFYDLNIDRFMWVGLSAVVYDDVLLPEIQRSIEQGPEKLCLIVHFKGSHFDYRDRYRQDFAKFPVNQNAYDDASHPEHVTAFHNAYLNSIIQTNVILEGILNILKTVNTPVFLLYSPDHAESFDVANNLFMHGNLHPKKAEVEIPLLIWANTAYQKQFPAKWQALIDNQNRLISTRQILPTLMDALAIKDIPTYLAPSLMQHYKKDIHPMVLLPEMELVSYKSL